MSIAKSKEDILRDHGYIYDFDKSIYVNKKNKQVFSEEIIDDNDDTWLKNQIDETNDNEWAFHSNQEIPDDLKDDIIKSHGTTPKIPIISVRVRSSS